MPAPTMATSFTVLLLIYFFIPLNAWMVANPPSACRQYCRGLSGKDTCHKDLTHTPRSVAFAPILSTPCQPTGNDMGPCSHLRWLRPVSYTHLTLPTIYSV